MSNKLFETGAWVVTAAVAVRMRESEAFASAIERCLQRHCAGDWGDALDEHDVAANTAALEHGDRLLSSYVLSDETKVWIITEADRSVTTVLFPEDY